MTLTFGFGTATGISALASSTAGALADPCGFTRMLIGGALARVKAARQPLAREATLRQLDCAVALIGELRAGLDLQQGGTFAANADDLYDYICRRLRLAAPGEADRRAADPILDEVAHLLEALRSAWTFMPAEVRKASGN
jgi:flagellar protein FliS